MKIGVVIPCYKCSAQIFPVLKKIPAEVERIYVVDDSCPEKTGQKVQANCPDARVRVLFHEQNSGVGAAVVSGYRAALKDGLEIVVKIDGDGQMDPVFIHNFILPIATGRADYTKGNRFFSPRHVKGMPLVRLLGNSALSFLSKLSTGYWQMMDPNNGYTAIHGQVLAAIDLDALDRRFFFETDLLYHLNLSRAVVQDIPLSAAYGAELSNLKVNRVVLPFFGKHLSRFIKRIVYTYFIRDFNIGSLEAVCGSLLMLGGTLFGSYHWYLSAVTGIPATSGTVMIAGLALLVGFQLILAATLYDITNTPKIPLHSTL